MYELVKMNSVQERPSPYHRARTSFFIDDILLSKPRKSEPTPPLVSLKMSMDDSRSLRESSRERFLSHSAAAMLSNHPSSVRTSPGVALSCSPPAVHVPLNASGMHLVNNVSPMLTATLGSHGAMCPEFAASYAAYLPGAASYLGHQHFAHSVFQAAAAAAAMSHQKHLDHHHGKFIIKKKSFKN